MVGALHAIQRSGTDLVLAVTATTLRVSFGRSDPSGFRRSGEGTPRLPRPDAAALYDRVPTSMMPKQVRPGRSPHG